MAAAAGCPIAGKAGTWLPGAGNNGERTFAAHSHFLAWQLIYVRTPQRKCRQKDTEPGSVGKAAATPEATRHFHSENYAPRRRERGQGGQAEGAVPRQRANVSVYKNSHFNICQLAARRVASAGSVGS